MLLTESALGGFHLEAVDGDVGIIKDCLFDDRSWTVRWFVVDTGLWLTGRKILIHPSAVTHVDFESRRIFVKLTKLQIDQSPNATSDEPVSRQWENSVYDYYGWNPFWGNTGYYLGYPGTPGKEREPVAVDHEVAAPEADGPDEGDAHLRSAHALNGYHVQAKDGAIGHVGNFLVDDATWRIRYIVVDTKDWWFGQQVLLAPTSVSDIAVVDRTIDVKISREQVKSSPPWNPLEHVHHDYERRLNAHYGWADHG